MYTNSYEFSGGKENWQHVKRFLTRPWQVQIGGMVRKPLTLEIDDILKGFAQEERHYRHRCVETWAMAVPWCGFPLAELLKRVEPLAGAKYVRFISFLKRDQAPGQKDSAIDIWPYHEGLTIEEANNELAFLATGIYGQELPKQHGAPIRLVLPWKYGFKSIKSITAIELTDKKPETFWNILAAYEYGFWANVNPQVPHPRWSQANETMLGSGESRKSVIFNGYGQQVAHLYPSSDRIYFY
jgi:sulfoxide reductase catalytic subunit YedY